MNQMFSQVLYVRAGIGWRLQNSVHALLFLLAHPSKWLSASLNSHFTENAPMAKTILKATPGAPRMEDGSINCVPQRGPQVKAAADPDALPHFEKNISGKLSVDFLLTCGLTCKTSLPLKINNSAWDEG